MAHGAWRGRYGDAPRGGRRESTQNQSRGPVTPASKKAPFHEAGRSTKLQPQK